MKEIARREDVDDSYVSGMVNFTTLAPHIVAAILDDTLSEEVTLFELAAGTPLLWEEQRGSFKSNQGYSGFYRDSARLNTTVLFYSGTRQMSKPVKLLLACMLCLGVIAVVGLLIHSFT